MAEDIKTDGVMVEDDPTSYEELPAVDAHLLEAIAMLHGKPTGAFNIRRNGKLVERHSSANITIETKDDYPGINIRIAPGTQNETVHIPVILTASGVNDVVYNTFYVGEGADVLIVAGCGIHNPADSKSEHDGIHSFYIGKNAHVRYIEKHYGQGTGSGERVLNPTTNVECEEGAICEMDMIQLGGVTTAIRDTHAKMFKDSKLVITEKLMTDKSDSVESNVNVELLEDGASVQVVSRSVAKGDSKQVFAPLVTGNAAVRGHVQCDAIIMDHADVKSVPAIQAKSDKAVLVHEAAIGKIEGEQIIKLETLGLSEEEAEQQIIKDFLS